MKSAQSLLRVILKFKTIVFFLTIGAAFFVSAHETGAQPLYSNSVTLMPQEPSLEATIASYSVWVVVIAGILITLLAAVSLKIKKPSPQTKKTLFFSIIGIVTGATLFLAVSTVYLNLVSTSGGPVHWHADFEVWACGKELDLKDPTGWSNKIGTATLHEHNDKRIHLEGVVLVPLDASLGKFFSVIHGSITSNAFTVPTNNGTVSYQSGSACPNGAVGELQVFAYKAIMGKYVQYKITDPSHYIISPYSAVPPGDCIIVEFDTPKEKTDKLCTSYKVAETIGKIQKGY